MNLVIAAGVWVRKRLQQLRSWHSVECTSRRPGSISAASRPPQLARHVLEKFYLLACETFDPVLRDLFQHEIQPFCRSLPGICWTSYQRRSHRGDWTCN